MTAPKQKTGFRHFHDELAQLKQRLLDMSGQAERLVDLAIKSLLERDRAIAEEVIAGDKLLNELEVEIEQRAVKLLALQQPMARDLRFLVGAIKVSSDLERVGDHAVNIAESAEHLVEHGGRLTPTPAIEDMARRAGRCWAMRSMRSSAQMALSDERCAKLTMRLTHSTIRCFVCC